MNNNKRWLILALGVAFFFVLGFLAQYFFRERCLNYDSAYYIFKILQHKTYNVELGRDASIITQYLPVFAVRHYFPLALVLKLYSVNFIINQFIFFVFILLVLRNEKAAIVMLLALCLTWRGIFYYMVPEFHLGLLFCILIYALVDSIQNNNSLARNLLMLLATVFLVYLSLKTHLLTVFCLFFVIVYQALKRKQLFNGYLLIISGVVAIAFIYLRYLIPISEYEKAKIIPFSEMVPLIPKLFSYPSTKYIIQFASDHFLCIALVIGIVLSSFVASREYLKLAFFVLFPVAFIVIVLLTLHNGDSSFQYENYFITLGFFFGIPFVDLLHGNIRNKYFFPLIVLLLGWSLTGIAKSHIDYTNRIGYVNRIMHVARATPNKKLITSPANYPWTYTWSSWALPFESILLSVLDSPDSAATFILEDVPGKFDSLVNKPNIFLGPTWMPEEFSANTLNKTYFNISGGPYIKANSSQRDSAFKEEFFTKDNFHLFPDVLEFTASHSTQIVIPVRIVNQSGQRLNSLPDAEHNVYMGCHIVDEAGNTNLGLNDPLETDVYPSDIMKQTTHGLRIITPAKKGTYTVLVDMVTENKRWWGINGSFTLVVK